MNTFYAIREKGSGKFLPDPYRSRLLVKVSYTNTEPTDSPDELPRLFTTPQRAKAALTQWLRGRQYSEPGYQTYEGDWVGGGMKVTHDPTRLKENMEVVEIELRAIG